MKRIDTLIFDLDGVLYRGDQQIDGANDTLSELRKRKKKLLFFTNNSEKTREEYVEKLRKMGIMVDVKELYTSGYLTALYLKKHHPKKPVFVISTGGLKKELEKEGILVVEKGASVVAVGLDKNFSYNKLAKAFREIKNGAIFIASNADRDYPVEDGLLPGAGAIVNSIVYATKVEPLVIGKPNRYGFDIIKQRENIDEKTCVMIGDKIEQDILFAKNVGMESILVFSGSVIKEDLKHAEQKPDVVINSVRELLQIFR